MQVRFGQGPIGLEEHLLKAVVGQVDRICRLRRIKQRVHVAAAVLKDGLSELVVVAGELLLLACGAVGERLEGDHEMVERAFFGTIKVQHGDAPTPLGALQHQFERVALRGEAFAQRFQLQRSSHGGTLLDVGQRACELLDGARVVAVFGQERVR